LTQFAGAQFLFGGAWVEPTFKLDQSGPIPPIIQPFSATAENQGLTAANIGVSQDLSALGMPATFGMAFVTNAAGGVDFRQVPASNGTNSVLEVFEVTAALGLDLTERLSAGASLSMGIALFDGPFVGIGGTSYDYALRSNVGLNYDLGPATSFGAYYQTKQNFSFKNAIELELGGGVFQQALDVDMGLPDNVGLGVANSSLLDGQLLLALDVLFKQWDNADLFRSIYQNQWVAQLGAQLTRGRVKYRLGYAYAENPLAVVPDTTIGGIPLPRLTAEARYVQAQMAITNRHRISGGVGIEDILPNVDFDTFAGGMFDDSQQLGPLTSTSLDSWWIGAGLTWRFGPRCGNAVASCD
jgi:long-chain fatty acid transport protein